jgi:hypothetical protein
MNFSTGALNRVAQLGQLSTIVCDIGGVSGSYLTGLNAARNELYHYGSYEKDINGHGNLVASPLLCEVEQRIRPTTPPYTPGVTP